MAAQVRIGIIIRQRRGPPRLAVDAGAGARLERDGIHAERLSEPARGHRPVDVRVAHRLTLVYAGCRAKRLRFKRVLITRREGMRE